MNGAIKTEINGWLKIILVAAIPLVPYTAAAVWWAAGITAEQKRVALEIEAVRAERAGIVAALAQRVNENVRINALQDQTYQEIQRQIADIKAAIIRIEARIDALQRRP